MNPFASSFLEHLFSRQRRVTPPDDTFRLLAPTGQQLLCSPKEAAQFLKQELSDHEFCPYVGLIPKLPDVKFEALWYLPHFVVSYVWDSTHPEFSVGAPPLPVDNRTTSRPTSKFLDPALSYAAARKAYQETALGTKSLFMARDLASPVGLCFSAPKLTQLNGDTPFVNRQLGLPVQLRPDSSWSVGYTSNSVTVVRKSQHTALGFPLYTAQTASATYPAPKNKLFAILAVGTYQQLMQHSGFTYADPYSYAEETEQGTNRFQAMHTILPLARVDADLRVQEDTALAALVLIGQQAF